MENGSGWRRARGWIPLALAVGVLVGSFIRPAAADLGSFNHLRNHFLIDKVYYHSEQTTVPQGSFGDVEADCPGSTKVVGGGMTASAQGVDVVQSFPSDGTDSFMGGFDAWTVNAENNTNADRTITVTVICVRAGDIFE